MRDAAGRRRQLRFRDAQLRGRGGDEHLARGGADPPVRIVVAGNGGAAAGALRAVLRVEVALLDGDHLPVDVQLLGDDHRQRRLDALADLGVLADDGDLAVGGDLDEDVRNERRRAAGRGPG